MAEHNLATGIKGQSSMKPCCHLGSAHRLAWFLTLHIRSARGRGNGPFGCPFGIAGARSSRKQRNNNRDRQLNAGDDPVRTGLALEGKARATNKETTERVARVKPAQVASVIYGAVDNDAVCMDKRSSFRRLEGHESVNHNVGPYTRYEAHAHTVDSFRSISMRSFHSTSHKGSEEHFGSDIRGFADLREDRRLDRVGQMPAIVQEIDRRRVQISGCDRISGNRRMIESGRLEVVRRPPTQSWASCCESRVENWRGSDFPGGYSASVVNLPTEGEIA